MSDAIISRSIGQGYRGRLAALLPAMNLAYFMLIWPLVYARGYVPADLSSGPVAEAQPLILDHVWPTIAPLLK